MHGEQLIACVIAIWLFIMGIQIVVLTVRFIHGIVEDRRKNITHGEIQKNQRI